MLYFCNPLLLAQLSLQIYTVDFLNLPGPTSPRSSRCTVVVRVLLCEIQTSAARAQLLTYRTAVVHQIYFTHYKLLISIRNVCCLLCCVYCFAWVSDALVQVQFGVSRITLSHSSQSSQSLHSSQSSQSSQSLHSSQSSQSSQSSVTSYSPFKFHCIACSFAHPAVYKNINFRVIMIVRFNQQACSFYQNVT